MSAANLHYKQAVAHQADAERGLPPYQEGKSQPVDYADVPMTRDQQFLAANTHALLAIFFELREQTKMM